LAWRDARRFKESALKDVDEDASIADEGKTDEDAVTINRCMDLFTVPEKLAPEDAWYCNICKKHQEATKKFDIWTAPDILVIHLKRFSYRNQYMREKIESFVDFPLVGLDLSKHILQKSGELMYDCYAISNHYGSLGGGHYTAFAINPLDGKWYSYDDSHVSQVESSAVKTTAAYVLFFKKRGSDAATWDLTPHITTPAAAPAAATTEKEKDEEGEEEDEEEESDEAD